MLLSLWNFLSADIPKVKIALQWNFDPCRNCFSGRKRKKDFPSAVSHPKWAQGPELVKPKPGGRSFLQVSHVDAWTIFHCFPTCVSRELDQKWSRLAPIWDGSFICYHSTSPYAQNYSKCCIKLSLCLVDKVYMKQTNSMFRLEPSSELSHYVCENIPKSKTIWILKLF